ncbi:MAG TPA: ATP-binding cassette domain-containing protein [Methylomirabilota bacterium]|nr:ATP-binding cassette domain-containing protein [Methylomirabilota bacterium]
MIALTRVTKRFGDRPVVERVSLVVEAGTTHVLLGGSGSGKSTLLRLVLGLLTPDEGEVSVDGVRVTPASRGDVQRRIGYVVQEGALYPHLTAADNAMLPARARGWPAARMAERLAALARLADLDRPLLERYPAELSGGQRQRVGLMRALALDPPVLLLDEPLGALDPLTRAELQGQLLAIFRELGKTVLLVTHDVREAFVFGRAITLLDQGRVVQQGTFADLARRPATPLVTAFLRAQAAPPEMAAYL